MARVARRHVIVPAVEVMLEADQLRLAGKGAGEPHRHQGRLSARGGETHALRRGDELQYPLGPGDLSLVRGAEMGAALDLLLDRLDDLGMAVAEQQRAVAAEIVDVAIAVNIPFPRPLR